MEIKMPSGAILVPSSEEVAIQLLQYGGVDISEHEVNTSEEYTEEVLTSEDTETKKRGRKKAVAE